MLVPASALTCQPTQAPMSICHRCSREPIPTSSALCREAGLTEPTIVLAMNAVKLSESIVARCGVERRRQEVVQSTRRQDVGRRLSAFSKYDDRGDTPHGRHVQVLLRRRVSRVSAELIHVHRSACTYKCSVSVLCIVDRRNLCK